MPNRSDLTEVPAFHCEDAPMWSFFFQRNFADQLAGVGVRHIPHQPQVIGPTVMGQAVVVVSSGLDWILLGPVGAPGAPRRRQMFQIHAGDTFERQITPVSEDGRFRVTRPITVDVSDADRDGVYVVSDRFSTVFGSGETPRAAIADYEDQLFLTFEELEDEEASLGGALRKELGSLRQHVVRT